MYWLFLLMAVGALAIAMVTTSMPLTILCLLAALVLFVLGLLGRYAQRVGETSRDPSQMIDPAELRRLRELAEARRAAANPPGEPPAA